MQLLYKKKKNINIILLSIQFVMSCITASCVGDRGWKFTQQYKQHLQVMVIVNDAYTPVSSKALNILQSRGQFSHQHS